MNQGDVILTPVPQANGILKNRPAIFLREMPPYRDLLVCGISTQLHQEVKGFDEVVDQTDFRLPSYRPTNNLTDSPRISSGTATERCDWFNRLSLA